MVFVVGITYWQEPAKHRKIDQNGAQRNHFTVR
jgi:hypothetical protein